MNRQTIIVHHNLTGALQSFSKNLFLDFTPSTVIIRGVDYGEGAGATDLHGVFGPWSDNPIATFIDDTNNGYVSNPGTTFKINNPGVFSNGQLTFQVRRLNNATSASTATGKISLTLEFVMEEPKTQQINFDMSPLMKLISERIPVNAFSREISFGMGDDEGLEPTQTISETTPEMTDTRNTEDQVNPIPNVHSTIERVPELTGKVAELKDMESKGEGMTKDLERDISKGKITPITGGVINPRDQQNEEGMERFRREVEAKEREAKQREAQQREINEARIRLEREAKQREANMTPQQRRLNELRLDLQHETDIRRRRLIQAEINRIQNPFRNIPNRPNRNPQQSFGPNIVGPRQRSM